MARKRKSNTDSAKSAKSAAHVLSPIDSQAADDFLGLFEELVRTTPRDSNGFLTRLIDHQMIPPDYAVRPPSQQQQIIQAAEVQVTNVEGYPATGFHQPIWNQLQVPNEPDVYYHAFRSYLLSPARSLNDALQSLPQGFTPYTLREIYTLFYWKERATAYDILRPVAAARLKDQRLLQMEDNHYLLSNKLLQDLTDEIKQRAAEQKDRPWQGLAAIDLMKSIMLAAELQRTSVGLPAKGPKLNNVGYTPAPYASIDRAVRETATNYVGPDNTESTPVQKLRSEIDQAIAKDPKVAAELQQAVLNVMLEARKHREPANDAQNTQQHHANPENPHDPQQ